MFKKQGIDVLDIPELHRKKLIKLPEPEKHEETKITNDGYFVLEKQETQSQTEIKTKEEQEPSFLSNFASIGQSNQSNESKAEQKQEDVTDLKWRLENLEFKLEQLIERVNSIGR